MSKYDAWFKRLFPETKKPLIPLLRIFLTFISMKEVLVIRSKLGLYFQNSDVFYAFDWLADSIYTALYTNYEIIIFTTLIFGFLSIIGLATRLSLFIYATLYFCLMYFDISTGIYNHEGGLTAQILLVLIFADGVKNWSIDSLIRSKFDFKNVLIVKSYSNWSIKLILVLMVMGYLTAGISKIRYGGIEWLNGQTLSYYLSGAASHMNEVSQKFITSDPNQNDWKGEFSLIAYTYGNFQTNPYLSALGKSISDNEFILKFLSIFTVILELGAVFMLFSPNFRNIFLLMAVGFHFSIRLLMGLGFLDYQVICLCLIDWSYLFNTVKGKLLASGA